MNDAAHNRAQLEACIAEGRKRDLTEFPDPSLCGDWTVRHGGPKQAISLRLRPEVIAYFRALAGTDASYQALINQALVEWIESQPDGPLLTALRKLIDEKLEPLEAVR